MSYSKLSLSLLVKHSSIFPGEEINVDATLRPFGRKLVLQMVAVLNATLQRGIKDMPEQLRSWFGQENPITRDIFHRVFEAYREPLTAREGVHIINDYANLRLSEIAITFGEPEQIPEVSVDEKHMALFKAYLWLNEEYLFKQENISATLPEEHTGLDQAAWMATATLLSYYDFTYSTGEYIFLAQLIKAKYCFEFLAGYHPEAFGLYLQELGYGTFMDYANKITPLAMLCTTDVITVNAQTGEDVIFLDRYDHRADIEENEENSADYDFLQIRNRPLFKIGEKDYLLLNRSMVINKTYGSIYWDMKGIFMQNPQFGISENKFRQDYTGHFSEEFLVYKLLQKAYGTRKYKQHTGTEMKAVIGDTEPDYYIRNGNKLFLYEVKDSFIVGTCKQSFDVAEIQKELKKKYFGREGSGHEKAVKQLVTRVRQALVGTYKFDETYQLRGSNIFPILIVYDINVTVPGVERTLMGWFATELEKLDKEMAAKDIKGYRVHDLVVLHIDGLVLLSEYLAAGKLTMEELIGNYLARYKKLLKQSEGKTFQEVKANALSSYLSFQHYVMDNIMDIPVKHRLAPRELRDL